MTDHNTAARDSRPPRRQGGLGVFGPIDRRIGGAHALARRSRPLRGLAVLGLRGGASSMSRAALFVAVALALAGCGVLLEMLEESPEEAARRAEAARQAALPIAQASCGELGRRASELESAIDYELARQAQHEQLRELSRAVNPRLPSAPMVPPPRSMAGEYATIGAVTAEMARRCPT